VIALDDDDAGGAERLAGDDLVELVTLARRVEVAVAGTEVRGEPRLRVERGVELVDSPV
jgi:hypothetical protein